MIRKRFPFRRDVGLALPSSSPPGGQDPIGSDVALLLASALEAGRDDEGLHRIEALKGKAKLCLSFPSFEKNSMWQGGVFPLVRISD